MKIRLTLKTPDVLDQLSPEEREALGDILDDYIKYSEYINISIDTETKKVSVEKWK